MALRILFFGTPSFALPSLDHLVEAGHQVTGVVTQPDRPKGRGQLLAASPVKARAEVLGLPVHQPERLREPATFAALGLDRVDIAVVAAFGQLLPQALLDMPRLGFVNVHASLLPRWRGAAPVHRAILAGDRETGVTIMQVVLALDAGPMLARRATSIGPEETSDVLSDRLSKLGAELLVETLVTFEAGTARAVPQDAGAVTYAAKLDRRDAPVDWRRPAQDLHNQIRGLRPWPLATTGLRGARILLHKAVVAPHTGSTALPGTVLRATSDGITVACGTGALQLLELQPDGRRPMAAQAFLAGHRLGTGDLFDAAAASP